MPHIPLRRSLLGRMAASVALAALAAAGAAHAQTWPTKPVRIVVPVGGGGTTDIMSRLLAEAVQQSTGQTVIVELKPGANGAIAANDVMRAPPDGYTLLVGTIATHGVGPAVIPKLGFTNADFTPIGRLADTNTFLLASPSLGARTVKEVIDLAKAKPGSLNYYSTGTGSFAHLVLELFRNEAKVDLVHIPYKGFAEGFPDLASGKTHLALDAIASSLPYVKDGRLRALAVFGPKRSPVMPDVPTMGEAMAQAGLPGFAVTAWFGLYGPKGMAPDLARRINEEFNKALRAPKVVERFAALGLDASPSTPAEFGAFEQADVARWRRVKDSAGIKIE